MVAWPSGTAEMVDERFHAPQPTAFTVAKSYTSRSADFTVRNSIGEAVMEVERAHMGYKSLRPILILDPASRRPLITLKKFATTRTQWGAFRGQSTSQTDRLFLAVERPAFIQRGTTVHVFLDVDGNSSSPDQPPDFRVHSCYRGPMTVSRAGRDVAQISRDRTSLFQEVAGEHTYTVRINAGVDQAFVLALTIIHDQMITTPDW